MEKFKVLVVGGGFGGVRAALDLNSCGIDVALINDSPFHCYHPDLYEVATAILDKEGRFDFENLDSTVNIPLQKIFQDKKVKLILEKVVGVDLQKNIVITRQSNFIYDYLILNLGSTTSYFGIEGAENFSHPLKNAEDALNIRNDLEEMIRRNDGGVRVVIAGGGFTGVELSGELSGFLAKLAQRFKRKDGNITILEGSLNVLSGMPKWSQEKAVERLKSLGVNVMLNHKITKVTQNSIECDSGERFSFDYLIWTTGVRGMGLEKDIKGIQVSQKGQLPIEPDLRLKDYPHVFVIGDLAQCPDKKRDCFVPSTAWAAIGQGKIAAANLKNLLENKATREYIVPEPEFVVPIGKKFALANVFGLHIKGYPGWILKRIISLKYLISILPLSQSLLLWWRGVRIYINND